MPATHQLLVSAMASRRGKTGAVIIDRLSGVVGAGMVSAGRTEHRRFRPNNRGAVPGEEDVKVLTVEAIRPKSAGIRPRLPALP